MKKRRLIALAGVFVFVVVLLVVLVRLPRDYEVIYKVDEYEVDESYDKERKFYKLAVDYEGVRFEETILSDYINGKRFVSEVRLKQENDEVCLLFESDELDTYPVCRSDERFVDYDLTSIRDDEFFKRETVKKTSSTYEGIEMKSTLGKRFFVWDYKGYLSIDDETKDKREFLEKESYYNNLAYSDGEYLLTPNYDQDYAFDEVFVIDMKKGKLSKWKLDVEISYNSYYLGTRDGRVYMVDRKNKAEYELNLRKKKIERVDKSGMGKVWDSKWTEVSMTKLSTDDYVFATDDVFRYVLEDGILQMRTSDSKEATTISKLEVDKIVATRKDEVYYLVKDELYSYSPKFGENAVLKYSELGFNSVNSIYIY